jgi:hypothetical protein
MMHQAVPSSTVVVLEDANTGTPFRELDHKGSALMQGWFGRVRVVMPFDTEYRFRFKFPGDTARRRLEISIDGTVVVRDLIVTSGAVLERFLDSARKFKFVKATSEGVADPTSPSNGLITVKLWKERDTLSLLRGMMAPTSRHYGARGSSAGGAEVSDWGGGHVFSASLSVGASAGPSYEAGATVEGAASSQAFGTTQWQGDENPEPQVFEFQLSGIAKEEIVPGMYCARCGSLHHAYTAKFCSACGARR